MADEQIIYLSSEEELMSVRERLEQVKARRIILVIPLQTHMRSHVGWRVLHARMRELGKEVLVISSDRQIRAVAKAVGFRVADSLESPSSNRPRPARRRGRKGQQFGHYRLIQQLGNESFGEVYLGEHVEIGTKAVIKILHNSVDLEEFQNDVRYIARLMHPNIVRLLDFGVKDHKPFLVIDYAPKGSLAHIHSKLYSNNEPLPLPVIVSYTRQLAVALQYIHDQNLYFGNLNPKNILIGDNDEILLSDLDIAFMDRTKKTSIFIGDYTAPEQASGKCLPASDQYALGAIVYEWLCGSPPFSFNSSEDFHEKMEQLTNTSPPLLRTRVSTVPSDVEEVIMKALTRDPKQRFVSVEAFANALEQASLPGRAPNISKRAGQQFGNYRLIRLLGEGGFADVYLGKHINLNTHAAVKVLHTRLTTEDVEHFRTEARTIASLRHPHIIRVLDFGVNDNVPFLVMDYAPNGTLRDRHPKGSILPLARILPYIKQIASALQYAHDQRLIHRDIKPDNILLGHNNEILLSDFGIAIVSQSSLDQRKSHYDVAGTVTYMAPEQIQGHPHRNSDQYALGIIIYEWLCGVRPFNGSYLEIAIQHERALPEPLRNRVPSISPAIEKVVLTALAKDPKQRFASIQAFANALEQASQQKF